MELKVWFKNKIIFVDKIPHNLVNHFLFFSLVLQNACIIWPSGVFDVTDVRYPYYRLDRKYLLESLEYYLPENLLFFLKFYGDLNVYLSIFCNLFLITQIFFNFIKKKI